MGRTHPSEHLHPRAVAEAKETLREIGRLKPDEGGWVPLKAVLAIRRHG